MIIKRYTTWFLWEDDMHWRCAAAAHFASTISDVCARAFIASLHRFTPPLLAMLFWCERASRRPPPPIYCRLSADTSHATNKISDDITISNISWLRHYFKERWADFARYFRCISLMAHLFSYRYLSLTYTFATYWSAETYFSCRYDGCWNYTGALFSLGDSRVERFSLLPLARHAASFLTKFHAALCAATPISYIANTFIYFALVW